ncbi:MAG: hypothetical protein JXB14_03235 [Candidatus Altiarchaeota archaeon]|nr:hypothetical protein [Candidatus Altiarchaeota archaeon]
MPGTRKKGIVRLIPWIHSVESTYHAHVVEFIDKLPKNSVLGLEMTPQGLNNLHQLLDDFERSWKRNPAFLPEAYEGLYLIEVLNSCRRRNIRVVPIDTTTVHAMTVKHLSGKESLEERRTPERLRSFAKDEDFRERTFAEKLRDAVRDHPGREVFALMGGSHVPFVRKNLVSMGVSARTDLRPFSGPVKEEMLQRQRAEPKLKEYARKGDVKRYDRLCERMLPPPLRRDTRKYVEALLRGMDQSSMAARIAKSFMEKSFEERGASIDAVAGRLAQDLRGRGEAHEKRWEKRKSRRRGV